MIFIVRVIWLQYLSSIIYNYLNLPQQINVTSKGNIQFVYDAVGTKWQKIVNDQTLTPNKITTTTYIDGFIYNNDTLQYLATEEGRIRPKLIVDSLGYTPSNIEYVYDYYLKDHLGDVRMTLTEETQTDLYAATMEPGNAQVENQLFNNVSATQYPKPIGFDTDTSNHDVSRLNGSSGTSNSNNPRIGPSIVLQVMAGDTLAFGVNCWYASAVQAPPSNDNVGGVISDLLSTLSGDVVAAGQGKLTSGEFPVNNTNPLQPGMLSLLQSDSTGNYISSRPKAYLNWAAFDEQFNMVNQGGNSGALQIPTITSGQNAVPLTDSFVVQKNGYIYLYVSNESSMNVYFDNLVIHHHHGPLLEEDHYYPFGLNMAAICDQAMLRPENQFKFNGIEFNHKEFSDGTGLGLYTANLRDLDPQIGRWWQIDPKFDYSQSTYSTMGNDPIQYADPFGDTLQIQFETGFLGFGRKREVIYDNGKLSNSDGSKYNGKVKGFLRKTIYALNAGRKGSKEANSIISELQGSKNTFTIVNGQGTNKFDYNSSQRLAAYANQIKTDPSYTDVLANTPASAMQGGAGGIIRWSPSGGKVWVIGGKQDNDPTINLLHELSHGSDSNRGLLDERNYKGISRSEWQATYRENTIRQQMGLPLREYYRSQVNGETVTPLPPRLLDNNNKPIVPPW